MYGTYMYVCVSIYLFIYLFIYKENISIKFTLP